MSPQESNSDQSDDVRYISKLNRDIVNVDMDTDFADVWSKRLGKKSIWLCSG